MDAQSTTPTRATGFPWHREDVLDRLRQLWTEQGLSASAIAADLSASVGADLSRNAVMGKVNRLGLVGKGNPDRATVTVEPDPITEPLRSLPFKPPAPRLPGVALFEARESHCRWPIGEPSSTDFRFCGEPRESARWSWCAAHMVMGFDQRSSARRRADNDQATRMRAGKVKAA